jgi:hypothetical protein
MSMGNLYYYADVWKQATIIFQPTKKILQNINTNKKKTNEAMYDVRNPVHTAKKKKLPFAS